ncbi:MAG: helix-turn-helix domain-containing protein [Fimbriimonadaceae bacterium]|nr:helix-turn-helix domain-containing protein [Fimbriimonadaceae bacterium]
MNEDGLDSVFKSLSDRTRRRLLDMLKEKPRTTGDLCAQFPDVTRFAIMKHLEVLVTAGLVVLRRQGRERWNHINVVPLQEAHERWVSQYQQAWASSLLTLRRTVESESRAERLAMDQMTIEQEIVIGGAPDTVYKALTENIGAWWSHSFSDAPKHITLEPFPGGRFFEEFEGGGGLYATVTYAEPGKELRMLGPMGMSGAVAGYVEYRLEAEGKDTRLKLSHRVVGEVTDERKSLYTTGWNALLTQRLKPFVENGERYR